MWGLRRGRRSARAQGIRFRLAAALALALAPILVLSAIQSRAAYRAQVEDTRVDLTLAAQRSAANARARLDGAVVLLEALRPEALGFYCAERLNNLVRRLPEYEALARLSPTGRILCASGSTPAAQSTVASDWFQRLRNGERMVVARAPAGEFTEGPAVLAAVRAERPLGAFDGAFVAVLPLESLRPDIRDRALPAGSEVALTDSQGAILTATDASAFPVAASALATVREGAASTLFEAPDRQGRRRLLAAAPLSGQDVFVVISAPSQGLFSWSMANALAVFVLPLLAWALALLSVLIVTERIVVRWLAYLERIAAIYARGRFNVRPVQARRAPLEIRNLAQTIDEMVDAIEQRDASLRDSLAEKDALLREIHHRVKNNLQVITSLLNMQQRALTDPAARAAMSDTRQRIGALALIYRALYQSEDVRRVDVGRFLEDLVGQLIAGESGRGPVVRTEVLADTLVIDPDKLAPLALWAVEAVSNAQKHAFAGRGGALSVRFTVHDAESVLEVEDDGPGADLEATAAGVGRTLMTAFARQLRGRAEIERAASGGVLARLAFPTPEALAVAAPPADGDRNQAAA